MWFPTLRHNSSAPVVHRPRSHCPCLEALEDRCLLSELLDPRRSAPVVW
jgi:hypothetical protein